MKLSSIQNPPPCNSDLLNRYLDGLLVDNQREEIETHLDLCVGCRLALEGLAANHEFWMETATALDTFSRESPLRWDPKDLSLSALSSLSSVSNHDACESQRTETCDSEPHLQHWLAASDKTDSLGKVGKYEVLRVVGRGGMGLVLEAIDTELNRVVAIKTLIHHALPHADAGLRLAREGRVAAALRHPHVLPIYSFESWKDVPLIVMPMMEGGTLQQYALQHPLSVKQVLLVGMQITAALVALHSAGIVHRDLKPSNVLLQNGIDHVVLSDFGLARFDGENPITRTDALAGTPVFMSPEQAMGSDIGPKSDLFSFGSMLFWLCTGRYPFEGNSNYDTLFRIVHNDPNIGLLQSKHVPPYLQRLILKLLAKQSVDRWDNAAQVHELLRSCLAHHEMNANPVPIELSGPKTIPAKTSASPRSFFFSVPIMVGVALVVTAVGLGVRYYLQVDEDVKIVQQESVANAVAIATAEKEVRSRYGPLDELDLKLMQSDIPSGMHLNYWLRRLAYLPVDAIPADVLPAVQSLVDHHELATRELAQVVLNKNPFQEISVSQPKAIEARDRELLSDENPFVEVSKNE